MYLSDRSSSMRGRSVILTWISLVILSYWGNIDKVTSLAAESKISNISVGASGKK